MRRRLNGWQRIGIVASVLWVITSGFYQRLRYIEGAADMHSRTFTDCIDENAWQKHMQENWQDQQEQEAYSTCVGQANYRSPTFLEDCKKKARQERLQGTLGQQGQKTVAPSNCFDQAAQSSAEFLKGSWGGVAFLVLVPVPLAWLSVYLLIRLWRWVRRGFVSSDSSP